MAQHYKVIVIGCGAIGAATTYWLSRRLGGDVIGLEQFGLDHTRGASQDHSRVIRHAYSRTEYTSLTPAMFQSWVVTEQATGLDLVHKTGGLIIAAEGSTGDAYLAESAAALDAERIPYELLSGGQVSARWPQWKLDDKHRAVFDPEAGIVDIRRGASAHLALARGNGAQVVPNSPVTAIDDRPDGVHVTAGGVNYVADQIVLAGGAWNPVLLQMLGEYVPITLTEEQITYFATSKVRDFTPDRFPIYGFIEDDELLYYGFPVYGEVATKAGIDGAGDVVTPATRTFTPDPDRVARVERFLARYLPGALGPELYSRACCYDFPPDRDFILDHLPDHQRVTLLVGAGHAGKFAALIGRIASELVIDGGSRFPIEAFRADRPALHDVANAPVRVNSM